MAVIFNVISLGVQTLIDPTEGNANSENAAALVGLTFGSENDPLAGSVDRFSGNFGGGSGTAYDSNNNNANDTFSINGGPAQVFDGGTVFNATITYVDGTTATITAVVFQDVNGNTYWAPEITNNADQAAIGARPIQSLTLDSVNNSNINLGGDRFDQDFDQAVDGTGGADLIDASYTDAQGDSVSNGDDFIFAGAGDDTVFAGDGNDVIYGDGGNDSLVGGAGNDTIRGGEGNDTIIAGGGQDSVDGGAGEDSIVGGGTADTLRGGDGDDTILGSGGPDLIEGGLGADSVLGGAGDDTIYGGSESASYSSGGTDTVSNEWQAILLTTTADIDPDETNGISENAADLIGSYGAVGDPLYDRFADVVTTDANGDGILQDDDNGTTPEGLTIDGVAATLDSTHVYNATVTFLDGTTANFTAVVFQTATGEVYLAPEFSDNADNAILTSQPIVSISLDTINQDDTGLFAERVDADYQLFGDIDDRDDTLSGGGGNDSIVGGGGDDRLSGDAGSDTIEGGAGNDTIAGGAGADALSGGAGRNLLDYSTDGVGVTADLGANTASGGDAQGDTISGFTDAIGGSANDRLTLSDVSGRLWGGAGADTLTGGAGDDIIEGGFGADVIDGGAGDDSLMGGADADTFVIGDNSGTDTIDGGETGTDADTVSFDGVGGPVSVIFDGAESATYTTPTGDGSFTNIERATLSDFDDTVDATVLGAGDGIDVDSGAGDDTVRGGAGADNVLAGAGADSVDGGAGNDTLDGGAGDDTIAGGAGADDLTGGTGSDLLDYSTDTAGVSVDLGTNTAFGGDATGDTIAGFESALGGAGNDTLTLSDAAGRLDGNDGNDLLTGGAASDTIDGGVGDDTVAGGAGADVLTGGTGFDALDYATDTTGVTVDLGTNSALGGDAQGDTISEFEAIVGGSGNDSLTLGDISGALEGGVGDDTLTGGAGDDTLTGGDGDDTFILGPGGGLDTITDFNFGNSGALGDEVTTNNDFIDLSGYYDRVSEMRADFEDDGILNQSNSIANGGTVDYSDNTAFAPGDGLVFTGADSSSFTGDNTGVACFTLGARIDTPDGPRRIEDLQPGELVLTRDHGAQPVRWIGLTHLDEDALAANPKQQPVRIRKGHLGAVRDTLVSPQHGVLIRGDRLARATHLAKSGHRGVRVARGRKTVTYVHVMFDSHQIVTVDGVVSESFYPGPSILSSLSASQRERLHAVFPATAAIRCRDSAVLAYGTTARPFVTMKDLRTEQPIAA